ncbi:MAG: exonuclease SbcCD subunit D [Bulleidia sp.]
MKIIHCSDLHLNSRLSAHLNGDQARLRNQELTASFLRMIDYADENSIDMILIAGDLFDTASIPSGLRNTIEHVIRNHPELTFFYLRGNHDDNDSLIAHMESVPENLKCFDSEHWTSYAYRLENGRTLTVNGIEMSRDNANTLYDSLKLNPDDLNIVTLHGMIQEHGSGMDLIDLSRLKNHNIDYLALGHIHAYSSGTLDARGTYCYSGCLEGRGFDEIGEHGFVLLETDGKTVSHTFVPFAQRHVHVVRVDVSRCSSTMEMKEEAVKALKGTADPQDLVRIVLCGEVDVLCEKNPQALQAMLETGYRYLEVKDETRLEVNYDDYAKDASLKGEFVRLVQKDADLDENMKTMIIRCGIHALNGEDF